MGPYQEDFISNYCQSQDFNAKIKLSYISIQ